MQKIIEEWGPLVGRILLALIFLFAGIGKIGNFNGTAGYMAMHHVPLTHLALVLTIIIEIGGSLMLILGWKARWAAGIMFLWLIPVTLMMHDFWTMTGAAHQTNFIMFMKNLCIMGAMLMVMAHGPGPKSLDK